MLLKYLSNLLCNPSIFSASGDRLAASARRKNHFPRRASTPHITTIGHSCLCSSIKLYFIADPVRRCSALFLGYPAPAVIALLLVSNDELPRSAWGLMPTRRQTPLSRVLTTPSSTREWPNRRCPALGLSVRSASHWFRPAASPPRENSRV